MLVRNELFLRPEKWRKGEKEESYKKNGPGGHQGTAHAEADTSDEPDISRVHAGLHFPGG